ncbi:hypothetical protein L211DRAFT_842443 [Terfezia boudieri ATCC MYA-4762]|uniref:Fungal-type protein kinase domain-containing protein n=1 Tax=Terfezia boudieri ATCC MYA-4762 TaxID=1051890 RepID=A0A3N4LD58_9PEZI|nr:hypothetical protein L211DRAFT_842443 [Terfezia boudieri ATCC MYA-4762]
MTTTPDSTSLPNQDCLQVENMPAVSPYAAQQPQLLDPLVPLTHRSSAPIPTSSQVPISTPQTPPPVAIVQSAPATFPATRYRSTPIKRKAASIPLAFLPMCGGSTGKRRRLTSQVLPLLQEELHERWYTYRNFLKDFIHHGPWALSDAQAIEILALLCQGIPATGIAYKPTNSSYCCTPPGFADTVFPGWFCDFGNNILRMSQIIEREDSNLTVTTALDKAGATLSMVGDGVSLTDITRNEPTPQYPNELIQHSTPYTSGPGGFCWVSCRTSALLGLGNPQIRPDFVLTSNSKTLTWSTVLVVGEHHSTGKSEEATKLQLASYVEQVFIAQPFRMATIGIITSSTSTTLRLWRFDRAGAVGSLRLNYSSSSTGLTSVVQCLYSLMTRQLQATWFHTRSVSWGVPEQPDWSPVEPTNEEYVIEGVVLNEKLFTAGGIVSRGTCVWNGTLKATDRVVAVKYSWQSTKRTSEADNYSVARSKGVVGLPELLLYNQYEDVHTGIRRGVIPCTVHDPDKPTPSEESAVDAYKLFAAGCNRSFTRLVLGTVGKPISDSSLSPLEIARGLLAALIAHASLFFQGCILHRDVSINNIIAITTPHTTVPRIPPTIGGEFLYTPGTDFYGCLIDLDYAVVITEQDTSGIPERTGTYPFIAIPILQGTATHRYRHDLESFLYVLLWVACYPVASTQQATHPGPSKDIRQQDEWPRDDPLKAWANESEGIVASLKISNIVSSEDIFEELLERFRPGFDRFKLAARELRWAMWELFDTGSCTIEPEAKEGITRAGRRRGQKKGQTLGAGDVRIGVSNWNGFCDFRGILEELVNGLEREMTWTTEQHEENEVRRAKDLADAQLYN